MNSMRETFSKELYNIFNFFNNSLKEILTLLPKIGMLFEPREWALVFIASAVSLFSLFFMRSLVIQFLKLFLNYRILISIIFTIGYAVFFITLLSHFGVFNIQKKGSLLVYGIFACIGSAKSITRRPLDPKNSLKFATEIGKLNFWWGFIASYPMGFFGVLAIFVARQILTVVDVIAKKKNFTNIVTITNSLWFLFISTVFLTAFFNMIKIGINQGWIILGKDFLLLILFNILLIPLVYLQITISRYEDLIAYSKAVTGRSSKKNIYNLFMTIWYLNLRPERLTGFNNSWAYKVIHAKNYQASKEVMKLYLTSLKTPGSIDNPKTLYISHQEELDNHNFGNLSLDRKKDLISLVLDISPFLSDDQGGSIAVFDNKSKDISIKNNSDKIFYVYKPNDVYPPKPTIENITSFYIFRARKGSYLYINVIYVDGESHRIEIRNSGYKKWYQADNS